MLKRTLKRMIVRVIARRYFQPFFERLYFLSLGGMNIGTGSDVGGSGERFAISLLTDFPTSEDPLTVFDVGANVGKFAQTVLAMLGERCLVYCFEPSPTTFRILDKNLQNHTNVRLHGFGLGEREEELTLYSDKEGSGIASVYRRDLGYKGIAMSRTEQVQLRTLDEFCAMSEIGRIHYLKLDVEGHELSVLHGADRMMATEAIDLIQFEFGGCNIDSRTFFRDFFDLLSPRYVLYRLLQDGVTTIRKYHELDEIFVTTNFLAVAKLLVPKLGRL